MLIVWKHILQGIIAYVLVCSIEMCNLFAIFSVSEGCFLPIVTSTSLSFSSDFFFPQTFRADLIFLFPFD